MIGAACGVREYKSIVCVCLNGGTAAASSSLQSRGCTPELRSSFVQYYGCGSMKLGYRKREKQQRKRGIIVDNLGGQYEDNFEDVQRQMLDFFTYKAVRTVLNQLDDVNPTQYRWLTDYIASNKAGYGKSFIRNLGKEKHELAERIMLTRLQLYGKWVKKCDHVEMYKRISDQNLELLRERLMETVVWPPPDAQEEDR